VQKLDRALYGDITSARTLTAEIEAWRDAVAGGFANGGAAAVTAGIAKIKLYQDRLDPLLTTAKAQLALADKFAAETPGTDCERTAATIYQLVQLISPHARLEQIRKLQKAVVDLQTTLRTVYAVDQKWINNSLESSSGRTSRRRATRCGSSSSRRRRCPTRRATRRSTSSAATR
jgi:hypothetical protein